MARARAALTPARIPPPGLHGGRLLRYALPLSHSRPEYSIQYSPSLVSACCEARAAVRSLLLVGLGRRRLEQVRVRVRVRVRGSPSPNPDLNPDLNPVPNPNASPNLGQVGLGRGMEPLRSGRARARVALARRQHAQAAPSRLPLGLGLGSRLGSGFRVG